MCFGCIGQHCRDFHRFHRPDTYSNQLISSSERELNQEAGIDSWVSHGRSAPTRAVPALKYKFQDYLSKEVRVDQILPARVLRRIAPSNPAASVCVDNVQVLVQLFCLSVKFVPMPVYGHPRRISLVAHSCIHNAWVVAVGLDHRTPRAHGEIRACRRVTVAWQSR